MSRLYTGIRIDLEGSIREKPCGDYTYMEGIVTDTTMLAGEN